MKLNLYFILADENLFHPKYLKSVVEYANKKDYKVAGITIAKDKHKKGFMHDVLQQFTLWGPWGFLFLAINTVARVALYRLGLEKSLTISGVAKLYNIPVIQTLNVNGQEHLSYLKDLGIDIIISSNGQIFKNDLLSLPKIACINRHSSLLPKYGGVLPVFWAMYNGEKQFGVSVHYMVEKIDRGDILYQEAIEIAPQNSLFKNYMSAFDSSIVVTSRALENIRRKKVVAKFRKVENAYFSFPKDEVIREFKQKHMTFGLQDVPEYYRWFGRKNYE